MPYHKDMKTNKDFKKTKVTARMEIRCTPDEKVKLTRLAKKAQFSLSRFLIIKGLT